MSIRASEIAVGVVMSCLIISPAFASTAPAPAPVAGLGIGAAALLGAGYRMLRKRFDR